MTTYLENYLTSVDTLPQELKRNFNAMKELDVKTQEVNEKVEKLLKRHKHDKNAMIENLTPKELQQLQNELHQSFEWGEEKIKLASQTYDAVDKHIRRLDEDLRKFEMELEQERLLKQQQTKQVLKAKGQKTRTNKSTDKGQEAQLNPATLKTPVDVDFDMPVDPNEPVYCFCKRVSFGAMVGCDNENCPVEWFHYECVNLTDTPKGKWHCSAACKVAAETKKKTQSYK
jgi:inhibitor of growth protein 5